VEAINLLRIRILREMDRTGKKVLLLTSTGELEGKSTISSNLALSCAQKGFRVLLIDGDLRSPSVAKKFGLETEVGILDVLTGGAALEQAVHHYPDTTLDILPGHGTANAAGISQLIGGEETARVMEYAREHYDYVIVDSPPCGIIQDALMLAAHCDASLVVIRQDFLARTRILEMLDVLADTGTEILGCVINGEEGSVGSYGYGRYGYGSGYGYGKYGNYGKYGSGEKNGRKTEKSAPQGDV
jgi:receptor protein-tyrosine kinase